MTQISDIISQATSQSEYSNLLESDKFGIVSVKSYGAVGNGVTDDIEAIQTALDTLTDGGILFFPSGDYLISDSISIQNISNIRLTGYSSNLILSGSITAIDMIGTCDNIEIDHLQITGDGVIASGQKGIVNSSGQTLTNISIHDMYIHDVTVGISANADTSGTVDNWNIYNNRVKDIVGILSGSGYGIHTSNGNKILIYNNIIDNCSRHSIYNAKGYSSNNRIFNNTIINHRKDVASATILSAIIIARCSAVKVYNNDIINGYDGGIHITHVTSSAYDCYDIDVYGNKIINRKNSIAGIIVGEQAIPTTNQTYDSRIFNNKCITDGTITTTSDINFLNGFSIEIYGNELKKYSVASGTVRFIALGNSSYISSDAQCYNNNIHDNTFKVNGTPTLAYGVSLVPLMCTGTNINKIKDNIIIGTNMYQVEYQATLTNVNLDTELKASATYNPPSINSGAQATTTLTVNGANVGDDVRAAFSLDLNGILLKPYVSSTNTVTCIFFNGTASPVDLASGTLSVKVTRW